MNAMFSIGIGLHILDELSRPLKNVKSNVDNVTKSIRGVSNTLASDFVRGVNILTKAVEHASKSFETLKNAGDKLRDVGKSLSLKGAANVMIAAAPTLDAVSFEKGMAEVSTLTDIGMEEFKKKYSNQILSLSQELGQTPEVIVKSLYQSLSAGLAIDEAFEFIKKAGKAGIAGVSDTFTAVDLGTTLKNAFNLDANDMGKAFDVVLQTVKAGKTTFREIAGAFADVGASAASAGVSFEQVQAAAARLTLEGQQTGKAYTQIKYALEALAAPSSQAKKAFEKLGVEINAKTLKENDFLGTMDLLAKKLNTLDEVEKAETISQIFGSMEAQSFAKSFVTGSEAYKKMAKDIYDSTGAMDTAYSKMSETADMKFNQMKATFAALRIQLGNALLPAFVSVINAIAKTLKPIAEFAEKHSTLTKVVLGGVVAFGAMTFALGTVSFVAGTIIRTYTNLGIIVKLLTTDKLKLITALKAVTAGFWQGITAVAGWTKQLAIASFNVLKLSGTLLVNFLRAAGLATLSIVKMGIAFMTTPIGWIIAGVAAVAGIVYLIYKNWGAISSWFKNLWNGIKSIFNAGLNALKTVFSGGLKSVLDILFKFSPAGILKSIAATFFSGGKDMIAGLTKGILSSLSAPIDAVKNIGANIVKKFKSILGISSPSKVFSEHGLNIITGLNEGIKSVKVVDVPAPKIAKEAKTAAANINKPAQLLQPMSSIIKPLVQPVNQVLNPVKATINPIIQPVKQVLEPVKQFLSPIFQPVKQMLQPMSSMIKPLVQPVNQVPKQPISGQNLQQKQNKSALGITLNYNPTINITSASPQVREDFAKILKQNQQELFKILQDAQKKNMRLAY